MMNKTIAFLLYLSFVIAACSSNPIQESAQEAQPNPVVAGPSPLQIAIASADFEVGMPRLPFILFDGPERVADAQRVRLATFDLASGAPTATGWNGEAVNYSDYDIPYWVAYPEISAPGFWGIVADVILADGSQVQSQFVIETVAETSGLSIGAEAPPSQNRTLETEPDIAKLTSGIDPVLDFYQLTVAAALETEKPIVVAFTTPAFCQSQLCAPVLDSVEDVHAELGAQVNFIHIEVYKDFETFEFADEMAEWGLNTEPWVYVVGIDGLIATRFGGPVSPRELTETIEFILQ